MGYFHADYAMDGMNAVGQPWDHVGLPWGAVWQPPDAAPQCDSSFQAFHNGGFTAYAQAFDASWPEDLGLVLPQVGRPKARTKRSAKEQGLRTPSSVGTPVF